MSFMPAAASLPAASRHTSNSRHLAVTSRIMLLLFIVHPLLAGYGVHWLSDALLDVP
jgi:hypothetical protein